MKAHSCKWQKSKLFQRNSGPNVAALFHSAQFSSSDQLDSTNRSFVRSTTTSSRAESNTYRHLPILDSNWMEFVWIYSHRGCFNGKSTANQRKFKAAHRMNSIATHSMHQSLSKSSRNSRSAVKKDENPPNIIQFSRKNITNYQLRPIIIRLETKSCRIS